VSSILGNRRGVESLAIIVVDVDTGVGVGVKSGRPGELSFQVSLESDSALESSEGDSEGSVDEAAGDGADDVVRLEVVGIARPERARVLARGMNTVGGEGSPGKGYVGGGDRGGEERVLESLTMAVRLGDILPAMRGLTGEVSDFLKFDVWNRPD
jgi:hypothetical protein